MNRKGGTIYLRINGMLYAAKGEFTYNLGYPKREDIIGEDGEIHGFTETAQPTLIEGAITDSQDLDLAGLVTMDGETVTLELAVGKTIVLSNAWYSGEGSGKTKEGEIGVQFKSKERGKEI